MGSIVILSRSEKAEMMLKNPSDWSAKEIKFFNANAKPLGVDTVLHDAVTIKVKKFLIFDGINFYKWEHRWSKINESEAKSIVDKICDETSRDFAKKLIIAPHAVHQNELDVPVKSLEVLNGYAKAASAYFSVDATKSQQITNAWSIVKQNIKDTSVAIDSIDTNKYISFDDKLFNIDTGKPEPFSKNTKITNTMKCNFDSSAYLRAKQKLIEAIGEGSYNTLEEFVGMSMARTASSAIISTSGQSINSLIIKSLLEAMGDYGHYVSSRRLSSKSNNGIQNTVHMMRGSRVVFYAAGQNEHVDGRAIEEIADSLPVASKLMRENEEYIRLNATPWIYGNDFDIIGSSRATSIIQKLVIRKERDADMSFFESCVEKSEQRSDLSNWIAYAAHVHARKHDYTLTAETTQERLALRSIDDAVSVFIDETIKEKPGASVATADIFESYNNWIAENMPEDKAHLFTMSAIVFGRRISSKVTAKPSKNIKRNGKSCRGFIGIEIREAEQADFKKECIILNINRGQNV